MQLILENTIWFSLETSFVIFFNYLASYNLYLIYST
jgi:intracellular septation protein A